MVSVENGVLVHGRRVQGEAVDATLGVARADLIAALMGGVPLAPKIADGRANITGDATAFQRLVAMLDPAAGAFSPVLPVSGR
ncbi:alkyl sulfatase C-terminal domain-containing protein [Sphingomonas sp. MMS24-JH45]